MNPSGNNALLVALGIVLLVAGLIGLAASKVVLFPGVESDRRRRPDCSGVGTSGKVAFWASSGIATLPSLVLGVASADKSAGNTSIRSVHVIPSTPPSPDRKGAGHGLV